LWVKNNRINAVDFVYAAILLYGVTRPFLWTCIFTQIHFPVLVAPVHGAWSPWSDWNRCSADGTCNIGYSMRFRLCDNPPPRFGGRNCEGFAAESRMCHLQPCVGKSAHIGLGFVIVYYFYIYINVDKCYTRTFMHTKIT